MSQHINICWDFFLSILFEFPSCNNLSKLSNSFHNDFLNLSILASVNKGTTEDLEHLHTFTS